MTVVWHTIREDRAAAIAACWLMHVAESATLVSPSRWALKKSGEKRVRGFAITGGKRRARDSGGVESMRIKIHGGTPPNHGDSLCNSCRHSRITRGRRLEEELVLCEASHLVTTRMTFKVTSCSNYSDETVPSCWDLMQQAWILKPESGKRPAGFVRASDLRGEEFSRVMQDLTDSGDP